MMTITQCNATTAAGKRCTRRKHPLHSGYCAQHATLAEAKEGEQSLPPSQTPSSTPSSPGTSGTSASGPAPSPKSPAATSNVLPVRTLKTTTTGDAPHLIVQARAGTGKTTTLVEALKRLRGQPTPGFVPSPQQQAVFDAVALSREARSIGFVAFNKSIASELQSRVPVGCDAMTMHSMGFKAVRKSCRLNNGSAVDENRVNNIIAELTGKDIRELRRTDRILVNATKELVGLCKMNLVGHGFHDFDIVAQLGDLVTHYDVEVNGSRDKIYDLVPRVLERCKDVDRDGYIDYDDMIWLPVTLDLPVWQYDLLLVDEAQDLNRCQQALAKKAGRRLVLCGDDRQAIYGFAGADSESMSRMAKELSGCTTLPLTVTRRCGRAIVAEAKRIVPDFEAHESNPEGDVKHALYPFQPGKEWKSKVVIPDKDTYIPLVQDGDMVICRSNAPLVNQCLHFIRIGRRATIQGRDIGQGLINLLKKLEAATIPELVSKLDSWLSKETAKEQAKANPSEEALERLNDRYECLRCFIDVASSVDDVVSRIERVFDNRTDLRGVLFSSVHRAKGLESTNVFFLRPAVQPTRPLDKMLPWEREQAKNLEYVAVTRAIRCLTYVR